MALVVDIETVGLDLNEIPLRAADYLFRKLDLDDAAEEEKEVRRQEIIDKLGLDPTTGRIICVGFLDTERGKEKALVDREEKDLLASFWEILERGRYELYVTFNGKSFDFPFINIRSAILEVPPSVVLPVRPYTYRPHFDVREVLAGTNRYRQGNLDFFCAVFDIVSPKKHLDGAGVAEAYHQDRIDEIAEYCLADCRATASLYERLSPYYK